MDEIDIEFEQHWHEQTNGSKPGDWSSLERQAAKEAYRAAREKSKLNAKFPVKLESRLWLGDDWPERRVSIVDITPGTNQAMFINARYTGISDSWKQATEMVTRYNHYPELVNALSELLGQSRHVIFGDSQESVEKAERALAMAYEYTHVKTP